MTNPVSMTRKWLLAGTIMTGALFGLTPAQAQEATPAQADEPAADEPTEIVITGSRIKNKEYTSPSPVTVITPERSSAAGLISASEILQGSSVANGSGQINNTFTGYVVDGGDGINTVSLRGLGAQRSLVLLNGRRMPPAGVSGTVAAVDLNTLPEAVVQRYEILKDGASSVYGSDAVAGVVNVITRSNFEGLELTGTTRMSEQGGGETYSLAGIWGKSFDQGHFMISASAYELKPLRMRERPGLSCAEDYIFKANGSRADLVTTRAGESGYKCWGMLTGGIAIDDTYFREIRPGSTSLGVSGWYGPIQNAERLMRAEPEQNSTIISGAKRYTVFAQGEYRPTWAGGAEFYGELLLNRRESAQDGARYIFPYFSPESPQNPFGENSTYVNAPFGGGYVYPYLVVKSSSDQEVDVYRGVVGARGEWLGDWGWDMYLSHSRSDGTYSSDVAPKDRLFAGIGFNEDTWTFTGVCPTGAPAGCVTFNPFTVDALINGKLTAAEQNYFFVKDIGHTTYDQTIFEATTTGDLFQLPAGPVGAAFGVSMRKDKIDDVPGVYSRNSNSWGQSSAGISRGEDTLSEAFFEFQVPLLKGQFAFEDLQLSLSGRYSDYDSVGDDFTYKAGLNWALDNTFRVRGTYGTSFRAPALYEMFLNEQTGYLSQRSVDPCINWGRVDDGGQPVKSQTVRDNCAAAGVPATYAGAGASVLIYSSGSTSLEPETSTATTFGFVLTPPETGFNFAVDFWRIKVDNQIMSTGAGVVGACYGQETYPNNGFCDLFERDPTTYNILTVDASYRNIPSESTSGVDFTSSYQREFNIGTLTIDLKATYTKNSKTLLFPGDTVLDYNGTIGDPKLVGDIQTQFRHKDWTFVYTLNYVGESSNQGYREEDGVVNYTYAPGARNINYTKPWKTHDLTVRYQAKDWSVRAGVINLLDEEAPILSAGDNTGSPARLGVYAFSSQYFTGYIGRQFYLSLQKKF